MLNLSKKQLYTFQNATARIIALEGAVRSGKSYVANWIFSRLCREAPEGAMVICGKSQDSIRRNVVEELMNLWGGQYVKYFPGKRELQMFGRQVYCIGAADERAESKIRGGTFSGALVDEATLSPESFFTMLLSRLSRKGSKCILTTNPDSPFHWLKRNYLDREQELDLQRFSFLISDNPSLDPTYVENLKKEYRGLWYKRYIEGQWCLAEGSVYDFFDEKIHVIDVAPTYAKYWLCGVDYGTSNPSAFVLVGFNDEVYPNLWVEKEYYFASRDEGYQKTDAEYAQDLANFVDGYGVKRLYIDPSAASFKVEIKRAIPALQVVDAKNDVLNGIRVVSKHLAAGNLKVMRACCNMIGEFQSYVWDSKKANRGVDEPVKAHDHLCITGETSLDTSLGKMSMKALAENYSGKSVDILSYHENKKKFAYTALKNPSLTGRSQKIYKLTLANGKTLRSTSDHKVCTKRGYIEICNLLPNDEVLCYD